MKAQTASLVSRIEDNNEKFDVIQRTLVAQVDRHQEKMENAMHSIRSESIRHRIEKAMTCVDHKTQGLHKELSEKIDKTQVELKTMKTTRTLWKL
jgi:exonuclease VII large subunit